MAVVPGADVPDTPRLVARGGGRGRPQGTTSVVFAARPAAAGRRRRGRSTPSGRAIPRLPPGGFSGIVAGNVKDKGIRRIEQYGRYEIHGDASIMQPLDKLLQAFVEQHRMKLPGSEPYKPCYRLKTAS